MEIAYGEMGLSPEQLAGLTPFQFEIKLKGYSNGLLRREEDFRNLAWIIFGVNVSAKEIKSKNITKDDIWPTALTIAKAKERNEIDKQKINHILEAFKKQKGL